MATATSLLPNGYNPQTLQDVLSGNAASQSANLTDQYTQARRQTVADQAAQGRLGSGVANYPLTDLNTQYEQGMSGIQQNLATNEVSIPSEDWLNSQQFGEGEDLASQLSGLLKPNTLDQIFQGVGTAAPIVGGLAALA